jgi:hypothetical protein
MPPGGLIFTAWPMRWYVGSSRGTISQLHPPDPDVAAGRKDALWRREDLEQSRVDEEEEAGRMWAVFCYGEWPALNEGEERSALLGVFTSQSGALDCVRQHDELVESGRHYPPGRCQCMAFRLRLDVAYEPGSWLV